MSTWAELFAKNNITDNKTIVNSKTLDNKNTKSISNKCTTKLTVEDFFKDPDDEFEYNYFDNIYTIKDEFKEYILSSGYPFLDNSKIFDSILINEVLKNSRNYNNTVISIEKYNNLLVEKWSEDDSDSD